MTPPIRLLVLFLVWTPESAAQEDLLLPFSEHLDAGHNVTLRWGFDQVQDNITFELGVRTTGWVGFGFSPNGGMAGSDIVIGGVGPEGAYFTDRHAEGKSLPLLDEQQSYKLLSLTEADGQTVMKFTRFIKSCDEHDFPITEVPVKLIYAYGQTDDIGYHGTQRGTKEVNLLKYMPRVTHPDSAAHFDLTMTNFTVPARLTHYQCKVMRAPTFDRKLHIYRIESLIEHLDLVHHLLVYRCPPSVRETYEEECHTRRDHNECYQTVAMWGVGARAFELPEVAGIPIGGAEGEFLYRLEVHYNNRASVAGRVDSSGLRFHYTPRLRQHDAAILQTGLVVDDDYAIPPNASAFLTYGLCDTTHIPNVLSDPFHDLHVFSVVLHTHLAGRKLRVGHFRDGKQIDFLAMDEHYNFELQHVTNLGETKTVKLGDELLVECTYNTVNRTRVTWGGLATTNEMCLAFLYYYPAIGISSCSSFPDMDALMAAMGTSDKKELALHMETWDKESIAEYQRTLKEIPQYTIVSDTYTNFSFHQGMIHNLKASVSPSCRSTGSSLQVTTPVFSMLLLLWLAVLWVL